MTAKEFKYVIRNVGRKKKQTFFSMLSILISTIIILVNISLNNGIQQRLKQSINEAISGQLTIYKSTNTKINILEAQLKEQSKFNWTDEDTRQISKISKNLIINKRIRFGSLISYNDETSYVSVSALEDSHLKRLKNIIRVKKGNIPINKNSILISETTANELNCTVGDTILLFAYNTNNYMSDEIAIVSGVFEESGLATFLGYNSFLPYNIGKEIVQLDGDQCLEIIINSKDNSDIKKESLSKIIAYLDNKSKSILISPWNKTIPLFYSIVNVWQGFGYFTQLMFMLFSLIILISLITLIINSRKKEFGTLLAMGFSWRKITIMLCLEYLIIGFFAVLFGYLLTLTIISSFPKEGIHIASKDLQEALMTEYLMPIIYVKNFLSVLILFSLTICLAVYLSIFRKKNTNPIYLINNY